MTSMVYGAAYPHSAFESAFRSTFHPFLLFDLAKDGSPMYKFQQAGTTEPIKVGIPVDNPENLAYIYPSTVDPSVYVVISQVNVDTPLVMHFTDAFIDRCKGLAQLFEISIKIKRNGTDTHLNYVFVAMKPSNTRKYDYASFGDSTTDAPATFSDLTTRLYSTRPSFCTDKFFADFRNMCYEKDPPIQPRTPVLGLTNVKPVVAWYISMNDSGMPIVNRDNRLVVSANIPNSNNDLGYFVESSTIMGAFKFLSSTNDFVYINEDARAWLNANHVLATTNGLLVTGWTFPSNVLRFTKVDGPAIDVTKVKSWVQNNREAYARLMTCDSVLVQALFDSFQTLDPNTTSEEVPLPTGSTTIIYNRSMYLASLLYVNRTITQLESEIAFEQRLSTQLSSEEDCATLKLSLEAFVTDRRTEIQSKLDTLIARRDALKAIILENDRLLRANNELATFVHAPETVAVSNSIIRLRETVYDAVSFLRNHARTGIQLLNQTQL